MGNRLGATQADDELGNAPTKKIPGHSVGPKAAARFSPLCALVQSLLPTDFSRIEPSDPDQGDDALVSPAAVVKALKKWVSPACVTARYILPVFPHIDAHK